LASTDRTWYSDVVAQHSLIPHCALCVVEETAAAASQQPLQQYTTTLQKGLRLRASGVSAEVVVFML